MFDCGVDENWLVPKVICEVLAIGSQQARGTM